ncbi:hypothetical protein EJ04DRAFT_539577 [Polyplosphaeria fusca]|uniref:WD40 repeat-like protein n=1 Tax=Polyplosphaeria fusca TaxID=682080 RepID=A0A9P4R946_9PLEO|nr:hypothetical protein EJ04DRAFT_539577 [Polyplosphaeria fusca]
MSLALCHENIRVPITALAPCGPLFLAAEGPFLSFFESVHYKLLATARIFKSHVIHGIVVEYRSFSDVAVVVWGGPWIRAFHFDCAAFNTSSAFSVVPVVFSAPVKASDWILDLSLYREKPDGAFNSALVCAAVTAHNALLEVKIGRSGFPKLTLTELTSSSRSILYSAHSVWESFDRILVAAGTAFGEIILWSWERKPTAESCHRVHHVFLGHEGSVFGVQISQELLLEPSKEPRRLLASCSDDRTIRVWDISKLSAGADTEKALDETHDKERTHHTGFSNSCLDPPPTRSHCLAVGWGHLSRVWAVTFLDHEYFQSLGFFILSSGEDATSRIWALVPNPDRPNIDTDIASYTLRLMDTAEYHSGKNIWAATVTSLHPDGFVGIVTGGADGKITERMSLLSSPDRVKKSGRMVEEFSIEDIYSMASPIVKSLSHVLDNAGGCRPSTKADFFRSYAFLNESSFLLTTNSGRIYLETIASDKHVFERQNLSTSVLIDQMDELSGHSVCTGAPGLEAVFVAGSTGSIHIYWKSSLHKLHTLPGKIGSMFATSAFVEPNNNTTALLVTVQGLSHAKLLSIAIGTGQPRVTRTVNVAVSEILTGPIITSLDYIGSVQGETDYILLGFRRGSIAIYKVPRVTAETVYEEVPATLVRIIEQAHGKETVTAIKWQVSSLRPSDLKPTSGHMYSVGRDGCVTDHHIDFAQGSVTLVNRCSLPIGPNLEGLYIGNTHMGVYGFSKTRFVVYDMTNEEEVMGVDTGGSHRSWKYQQQPSTDGGGTIVWTRASTMHIFSQVARSYRAIRPGRHGREIKAVAACTNDESEFTKRLVATGAEDTDIRLFECWEGNFVGCKTLRKHTTGIQHLQWSADGEYLFSSGGCEEFYVWRVRTSGAQGVVGFHVVCESICEPQSEHSDLRIMTFEAFEFYNRKDKWVIAMVFSDSTIRIHSYDPTAAQKWQTLSKGTYFTSCLTQCTFITPIAILTTGTDGHAVLWPLSSSTHRPHQSDPRPPDTLDWKQPNRIHQSTSKTLASHSICIGWTLIVSGGDDSSLSFLVINHTSLSSPVIHAPTILVRAHASAVTACIVLQRVSKTLVVTAGNDQWVRLWDVQIRGIETRTRDEDMLTVKRVCKMKTSVADVSSMCVIENTSEGARVLVCGVGMELIRIEEPHSGPPVPRMVLPAAPQKRELVPYVRPTKKLWP